ncbi:hypothetical protein [Paraburkholderia rhynchosiae]|uniref:Uncharacterized protein n=1 Tax=Paraburkholderia rhynchosiae TaxID=487049 RepID=A0A2N7W9B8_9BURK|nr:hypothetical protein [Paraburkholderia rhynchosiae]PMS26006.1 hypothetical protein C0Z16_28135 [Paraburkholderia rhynchosiae]CAB3731109.1 hypothetical protein LMG27174_05806 [Paraburkholderia rhynchosiae]
MTTSGTVSFTVTRDDIIIDALQNLGVIAEGETPNAYQLAIAARKLNMLVKQWQGAADFAPGLKVWSRKRADLVLDPTKSVYSLGPTSTDRWASNLTRTTITANCAAGATAIPIASTTGMTNGDHFGVLLQNGSIYWTTATFSGSTATIPSPGLPSPAIANGFVYDYTSLQIQPLQILTGSLVDRSNTKIPLTRLTLDTLEALPTNMDANTASDPLAFYYERQLGNGMLYLNTYPADLSKYLHFVFLSPIQDFNEPTDNPDYPQNWFLALSSGLSVICGPAFSRPVSQDLKDIATVALATARNQDPETSQLYFQPDGDPPFFGSDE